MVNFLNHHKKQENPVYFYKNLLDLRSYFLYSLEEISFEINHRVQNKADWNVSLTPKKIRYYADDKFDGNVERDVLSAFLDFVDARSSKDPRCQEILKKDLLNKGLLTTEQKYALAGSTAVIGPDRKLPRIAEVAQSIDEEPSNLKMGSYMSFAFWNNMKFIEALERWVGSGNPIVSSISMASYKTNKSNKMLLAFSAMKEIGLKYDIHPYSKLFIEPFSDDTKLKIIQSMNSNSNLNCDLILTLINVEVLADDTQDLLDRFCFFYRESYSSADEIKKHMKRVLDVQQKLYKTIESELLSFMEELQPTTDT